MGYDDALKELVREHALEMGMALERSREALDRLDRERSDLKAEIAALQWITDLLRGQAARQKLMTLHDAMAEVLKTSPGRRMKPAHLAAEIDRKGLYRMRDGRPVETQQIHARANNYPELFKRVGSMVELA
jgi:N-methylhydantoinase B/oxoprolinase/acetone carboxylase alpha subunit